MKAKYFQDTDTLYLELRDSEVVDTRDLDSDTILDYDAEGNVVGITLEHAKSKIGGERMELEMGTRQIRSGLRGKRYNMFSSPATANLRLKISQTPNRKWRFLHATV